jgi:imidazolonepropionase-like amidohydrolase
MLMKSLLIITYSLYVPVFCYAQVFIKNTNVVDVEKRRIVEEMDVAISAGKIFYIGKGRGFKMPPGTEVIDGSGKYLMPGLADAHVHFFQSGGLYTRPDAIDLRKYKPYSEELKWVHTNMQDFLTRYLKAGITSVVDVGASYNFLAQRDTFISKKNFPLIYMTGPLLTTYVPKVYEGLGDDSPFIKMISEENTRLAVREQIKHKADFIKIWYIVTDTNIMRGAKANLPLIKAAIDEAHKNKLRVAVHATERITAQLAVEAGADFLVHNVDDEVVSPSFIELLKKNKVVLCPTLVVAGNYGKVFAKKYQFSDLELKLSNPEQVKTITDYPLPDTAIGNLLIKRLTGGTYFHKQKTADSVSYLNLKKLADAGVTIATGTDAGNIGTHHAGSYFNELKAMQHAGLSTWQLLQASTINGAKAVGAERKWGTIAEGKVANLLLLDSNPVNDLENWKKINTVILNGIPLNF